MARRRLRLATFKDPLKHSSTLLANVGSGSVPSVHTVFFTDVGARLATGATQVIKDTAATDATCNAGDIIKFVNICIQCAPRGLDNVANNGWLEWAIVSQSENTQLMGLTSLGTQTLGDTANKQYRNNCLLTGCIPLGLNQGNSLDLKIKIPPKWTKLRVGSILMLFVYFRSQSSTDVRTDSHRIVLSSIFKAYS